MGTVKIRFEKEIVRDDLEKYIEAFKRVNVMCGCVEVTAPIDVYVEEDNVWEQKVFSDKLEIDKKDIENKIEKVKRILASNPHLATATPLITKCKCGRESLVIIIVPEQTSPQQVALLSKNLYDMGIFCGVMIGNAYLKVFDKEGETWIERSKLIEIG